MTDRKRVAIVHPWLPQYRVPFFETLVRKLALNGVDVDIFYGETPPEWADRNDTGESPVCQLLPTRYFRLGARSIGFKYIKTLLQSGPYDLIILEQAIRNLETPLLVAHPQSRGRIAFWGHGKNYTVVRSGIEEKLKTALTNSGKWFFGYTQGGVEATVRAGFPAERATTVFNATDTTELRNHIDAISTEEATEARRGLGIGGPTALYIGGLDDAKRLPFLLSAAKLIHDRVPNFSLIVAGAGSSQSEVEEYARSFDFVKYVGNAFRRDKAKLFILADVLMMPGRVGLVAVESAAAGVPIVTTDWPLHAPEFEYLTPGTNCLVSRDNLQAYVDVTVSILQDADALAILQNNCSELGRTLTIQRMVEQFATGVLNAIGLR